MPHRDRKSAATRTTRAGSGRDRRSSSDSDPGRMRPRGPRRRPPNGNPVPDEVMRRLVDDPLFQVSTRDRREWIDPFSGEAVPCPEGIKPAAEAHWKETGSWRLAVPHSLEQLTAIRWRVDLRRLLPEERRLRQFGANDAGWLNPYSGEFEPKVQRDSGRISLRTVNAMAQVLARCPFAEAGIMLDDAALKKRLIGDTEPDQTDSDGIDSLEIQSSSSVMEGISEDLRRATDVQRNMLSELPKIEGYEIGVSYEPQAGVSGDFYEVMERDDGKVLIVVGDVSGHGVQAALVVVSVIKSLRAVASQSQDVESQDVVGIASKLNDEIKQDLLPGQFVTMFFGLLDPETSKMTCVLAGHHHMLIAQPRSPVLLQHAGRPGMAMGLVTGPQFTATLKTDELQLERGAMIVQYTDGLIEAIDENDQEFGATRFAGEVLAHSERPAQELCDSISDIVKKFADGEVDDDLTILAIHRLPK